MLHKKFYALTEKIGDIYRKVDNEIKTTEIPNQKHRTKYFKLLQTLSRIVQKRESTDTSNYTQ
jgi:predicted HD phosphohydrolase